MKIVIDIHDKLYDLIKHYERSIEIIEEENDTLEITLMRAVINGTPLPEHHGRLIDESKINKVFCYKEEAIYNNIKAKERLKKFNRSLIIFATVPLISRKILLRKNLYNSAYLLPRILQKQSLHHFLKFPESADYLPCHK